MRDMEEEEEVKADGEMGQFLSYFFFFALVLLFTRLVPKAGGSVEGWVKRQQVRQREREREDKQHTHRDTHIATDTRAARRASLSRARRLCCPTFINS